MAVKIVVPKKIIMWAWIIFITVIVFSPELFPKQTLFICRKIVKKIREDFIKKYGYVGMLQKMWPLQEWEEEPEI